MKKYFFFVVLLMFINNLLVYSQYNTPVLEGTHRNAFTKVGAPSIYSDRTVLNKVATSDFQVIYDTPAPPVPAQNAIEEAVRIWEHLINTNISQSIKILVKWENLGYSSTEGYVLAQCGATSYYNSPSLPQNVQYPIALAEYLLDQNLNADSNEMTVWVNSHDSVKWYYGLDGVPQANKTDMISVILHEIAHGLGYHATFNVSGDLGYQGISGFPIDTNAHSKIYDNFITLGSYYPNADLLLNYPNASTQLKSKLISNNVYFNGDNAWIQNGRYLIPKLYAPTSWKPGSSISHLDDDTYPQGNSNSLMTHTLDQAEVIHSPGEVGLAILKDMGWSINRLATFIHPEPGVALKKGDIDTIKWMDNEGGSYSLVLLDSLNNFVMTICTLGTADEGLNGYIWTVPSNITNGKYRIKEQFGTAHGITATFTITDQEQVAQPQLSHITGTYIDPITVTASCGTPGATIRYTINSTDEPNPSSPIFPSALICSTFTTIRVKAFKDGMIPSLPTVATYNFGTNIPEPTVSLPSGDYPQGTKLTISWPYGYDCWLQANHNNTEPPTPQSQGGGIYLIPNPRTETLYNANEIWHMKFQLSKDGKWGPVVYVIYNLKPPLRIAQIDDEITGDNSFGFWNKWENNQWQPHPDETVIRPTITSDWFLQAQQSYKDGTFRKYNVWSKNSGENYFVNHAQIPIGPTTSSSLAHFKNTFDVTVKNNLENSVSLNQGSFYLKDPWYIDDNSDSKGLRNRGINPLPVEMSYQTTPNITTGSTHKGVFLNQGGTGFTPPYYSVKAISPQDIPIQHSVDPPLTLNHRFYFQNWGGENVEYQHPNQLETGAVFTNENAVATANMKGTQLSNHETAYANNSQRKFIRGFSQLGGGFFNTYSSMNKVWLEFNDNSCTDNAWHIMNNGKPLSDNESKNPSVDYWEKDALETFAFVTYQEKNSVAGYSIKVKVFDQDTTAIIYSGDVINESTESYLTDASPVIAVGKGFDNIYANTIIVCWYKKDNGDNRSAGLYMKYGYFNFDYGTNEYKLNWLSPTPIKITGTNTNSLNASLSAPKQISGNYDFVPFHITYEESTQINYQKIKLRGNGSYTQAEQPITISMGSGYSSNYKPSIVAFADTSSRICWIGERIEEPGIIEKTVVFTASDYLGHYWTFGSSVNSVSINRNNSCYTIAWASSNDDQIKYTDCSTLGSRYYSLHIKGKDVQLANGTTPATMYALAFNTTQQPHYMQTGRLYSPEEQPPIEPEEEREGIAGEEDAQVYFNIGAVMVDEEQISFVDIPDTARINSLQTANEYLVSEPFTLTDNSNFFYSVKYGITDSMLAANMLQDSKALTFKVELLDAQTNEVLGVFDEVTYNQSNLMPYEKVDYQLLTEGIGERIVKMRLVIGSNFTPNYSVAEKYDEPTGLAKKSYKQISYQGSLAVKEYALEQNYPNPFNPITKISWQSPVGSHQTLKVYDVLGREVATLVNEW